MPSLLCLCHSPTLRPWIAGRIRARLRGGVIVGAMRGSASCRASYVYATRLPFDPGSPAAYVHVCGAASSWRGFGAQASWVR